MDISQYFNERAVGPSHPWVSHPQSHPTTPKTVFSNLRRWRANFNYAGISAEWARRSASQPSLLKGRMYTDEVLMCLFGLILLAPHLGHNGMYYRAETNFSVREYKKGIRKNWDIFQN